MYVHAPSRYGPVKKGLGMI